MKVPALPKLALVALAMAAAPLSAQTQAASACDRPPEAKEISVMADWLPWASQGPIVAAQLKGFYKDEGITVNLMSPANPADPIRLVAAERVTFSLTYVPEVMMAREQGIPIVSVGTTMRVLSSGLFFKGEKPIKSAADLKGMTLGVGPKQDAQAFLSTVLEAGGLTRNDVKIVDPGFAHKEMILTDRIDAAHGLTYGEGMVANDQMIAQGNKGAGWLMYTDFGVPKMYYQLLVGNENWIEKNAATTCRFLRATRKGVEEWRTNPQEAISWIAAKNTQFTKPQHEKMHQMTATHWTGPSGEVFRQDEKVWAEARDWALKRQIIKKTVPATTYFTNRFVN
ncbi:ABC transporter substrate-binding protein [Ramlibacter sp. AW1]|uniref:ABC transporter substrate-binding protein n=1 Tax=Ramlibacter aurantiacus TaxID=2801330 RepID=A0A936ZLB3_9BURK|nr:ABC transporter substrate-binding protein [Ramlibacter aurantiacus]MBL0421907.1 ABC transporter substrate-binding protein [Ramlibacter aurantiacus]